MREYPCYYNKADSWGRSKDREMSQKKLKKVVDKRETSWYTQEVVASRWQQRRTLITEQWKTLKDLKNRSILLKNETFKTVDSEIQNNKPEEILAGKNFLTWEFDPGSGWTLAACLTHASRTKHFIWIPSGRRILWLSGGRVSNAWVTCLIQGDNS